MTALDSMLEAILSLGFLGQTLHIAIPLALAAIGGAITERAGVIDLALEAKLLFGAFAAAVFAHATGSAYAGIAGGALAGAAIAALQMHFALRLAADQVIIGIALNLVALGGTRFLLQLLYGEGANSPLIPALGGTVLANPIFWLAVVAAAAMPFALARTPWGLRLRAAGDRPDSLVAVGVSPAWTRLWAGVVGGALAGAGGTQLSLSVGGFSADMSGGRGYVALAMVILAGWQPTFAALACVGIGAAYTLSIRLHVLDSIIPRDLVPLLPYVLTLVVLVIVGGGRHRPRSLGKL